jgi:hypothetical protein
MDWMDMDNFIDYQIFEIFCANGDWSFTNMKCWRPWHNGGKWRWIFFDGDAALQSTQFESYSNAMSLDDYGWPSDAHSSLVLRKLLDNAEFSDAFFDRLDHLLQDELDAANTLPVLTQNEMLIRDEIPNQISRFGIPRDLDSWRRDVNTCRNFLNNRACAVKEHTYLKFGRILNTMGCDNSDQIRLHLYPNPTKDYCTIDLGGFFSNTHIEVIDMNGRIMSSSSCSNTRECILNMHFPAGVYIAMVHTEGYSIPIKVIVL